MVYRIKAVDGSDDEIAEVLKELHNETFGSSAPQVEPERGWWWLAFSADERRDIAGFCGLTPTYSQPSDVAYLKRAGVLLSHRGQRLQRRFVRVREARARKEGFATIVTDTTDNPSSANNLIACGYRIYRPDAPWAFPESIYWYKDL